MQLPTTSFLICDFNIVLAQSYFPEKEKKLERRFERKTTLLTIFWYEMIFCTQDAETNSGVNIFLTIPNLYADSVRLVSLYGNETWNMDLPDWMLQKSATQKEEHDLRRTLIRCVGNRKPTTDGLQTHTNCKNRKQKIECGSV